MDEKILANICQMEMKINRPSRSLDEKEFNKEFLRLYNESLGTREKYTQIVDINDIITIKYNQKTQKLRIAIGSWEKQVVSVMDVIKTVLDAESYILDALDAIEIQCDETIDKIFKTVNSEFIKKIDQVYSVEIDNHSYKIYHFKERDRKSMLYCRFNENIILEKSNNISSDILKNLKGCKKALNIFIDSCIGDLNG